MEPLIAWRSGARKEFEVKDALAARTACGGGPPRRPGVQISLAQNRPQAINGQDSPGGELSHICLNPDSAADGSEGVTAGLVLA